MILQKVPESIRNFIPNSQPRKLDTQSLKVGGHLVPVLFRRHPECLGISYLRHHLSDGRRLVNLVIAEGQKVGDFAVSAKRFTKTFRSRDSAKGGEAGGIRRDRPSIVP